MNTLIICLSFFLANLAVAGVAIISDYDDTIRIKTHSPKAYTGIAGFFHASKSYVDEIHVLSGSPVSIKKIVSENLKQFNIPYDNLILKTKSDPAGTLAFKVKAIRSILQNSTHEFILIGDDVSYDPEVFQTILKEFPNRVLAAYIHLVSGKKSLGEFSEKLTPYWTPYELAMKEKLAGRMNGSDVGVVYRVISKEMTAEEIVPTIANCRQVSRSLNWMGVTEYAELQKTYQEIITGFCRDR